jgi:hypothetical protein
MLSTIICIVRSPLNWNRLESIMFDANEDPTQNNLPTQSNTVGPATPLTLLNLDWHERDLPEKERTKHVHRLHPYLGKYIPQLVEIFLRKFFSAGQTIFDPFAGSGTTLVQANELGIHSIGADISAFNILLCKAKTMSYDLTQLRDEVLDILQKTKQKRFQPVITTLPLFPEAQPDTLPTTDNAYLNTWYAPKALQQLLVYQQLIVAGDYQYPDLLKVILSRAARSARLTTHFDLDFPKHPQTQPYWCYKHQRICQPTDDALQFLIRYSQDTIKRATAFAQLRTTAGVELHHADSREVALRPIDGVITSPPYVGLIDYHQQHAYAYHLLGLEDRRLAEIGPAASGASTKAKARYQQDIVAVFANALQMMPSGGRLIVVAADRANLYPAIAQQLSVEVEAVLQRKVNRRTGRRASEFHESIFIWKKP